MSRLIIKDNTNGKNNYIKTLNSTSYPIHKISKSLSSSPKSANQSFSLSLSISPSPLGSNSQSQSQSQAHSPSSTNDTFISNKGKDELDLTPNEHTINRHHYAHSSPSSTHSRPHFSTNDNEYDNLHGSLPLIGSLVYTRKKKDSNSSINPNLNESRKSSTSHTKRNYLKKSNSLPSLNKLNQANDQQEEEVNDKSMNKNDFNDTKSNKNKLSISKDNDLFDQIMSTPITPTYSFEQLIESNNNNNDGENTNESNNMIPNLDLDLNYINTNLKDVDFNSPRIYSPFIRQKSKSHQELTGSMTTGAVPSPGYSFYPRHSRSQSHSYINREFIPKDESIPFNQPDDYFSYYSNQNPSNSKSTNSLSSKLSAYHISPNSSSPKIGVKNSSQATDIDPLDNTKNNDKSRHSFEFDYDLIDSYDTEKDPFSILTPISSLDAGNTVHYHHKHHHNTPIPDTTTTTDTNAIISDKEEGEQEQHSSHHHHQHHHNQHDDHHHHRHSDTQTTSMSYPTTPETQRPRKHHRSLTCAMVFTKPKVVEI